jgi:acyl dehydratase
MPIYFEDLEVGDTWQFGSHDVTAAQIQTFAERYDPQPFHTDPEAAAASPFGGLVASGWHTAAMTMRLLVEGFLADAATAGAVGVDELRWPAPVRPGTTLHVELEILETDSWDDRRGQADLGVTTRTDDGETVLSMIGLVLFERRPDET